MKQLLVFLLSVVTLTAQGQNIKDHYVSRSDDQATVYHTFPRTMFASKDGGDLTFDLTYRTNKEGNATINFTYVMDAMTPIDSIRFVSGRTVMSGRVNKLYVEPEKNRWKHRYSLQCNLSSLYTFFDATQKPEVVAYSGGKGYVYAVKLSAWRSYAPIGNKIFAMIRVNEPQ